MYIIQKSLSIATALMPKVYNKAINRNYHFCLCFRKNKLLVIGTNDMSTESARVLKFARRFKTLQNYMFMHAELDAISRLWGKTYIDNRITFVIIRLNRFNLLGNSRPCKNCKIVLDALGIDDIYWSNADNTFSSLTNKNVYKVH